MHAPHLSAPHIPTQPLISPPQVCQQYAGQVTALEAHAHPALDALTRACNTVNLERVRKIKTQHQRLTGRLQALKEVLERYMGEGGGGGGRRGFKRVCVDGGGGGGRRGFGRVCVDGGGGHTWGVLACGIALRVIFTFGHQQSCPLCILNYCCCTAAVPLVYCCCTAEDDQDMYRMCLSSHKDQELEAGGSDTTLMLRRTTSSGRHRFASSMPRSFAASPPSPYMPAIGGLSQRRTEEDCEWGGGGWRRVAVCAAGPQGGKWGGGGGGGGPSAGRGDRGAVAREEGTGGP
jgi:hypothetical protein